jgi:hypothetical protein
LKKNNKKSVWSEKCIETFHKIKELSMPTLILKVPDMDKEFLVCTDVSKEGVGGSLMKEG